MSCSESARPSTANLSPETRGMFPISKAVRRFLMWAASRVTVTFAEAPGPITPSVGLTA